jgi:hypothetical protein
LFNLNTQAGKFKNKGKHIFRKIQNQTEKNTKAIKDFIVSFVNLNNREPMETEIIDNLKDKMDVNTIKKIIESGRSLSIKHDNGQDENV